MAHLPFDVLPALVIFPPPKGVDYPLTPPEATDAAHAAPVPHGSSLRGHVTTPSAAVDAVRSGAPVGLGAGSAEVAGSGETSLGSGLRALLAELRVDAMRREICFEQQALTQ